MATNFTVANESSDLEIDQEGTRNISIIRNVSSSTIRQSSISDIAQSGDDDLDIVYNIVESLVEKVCENVDNEKAQKETEQREINLKMKPKRGFNVVTRSMTKEKERTGVQKDDVPYDKKNEDNPSKTTVKKSKENESDIAILEDDAESLDLVLTALNEMNRKVNFDELNEFIKGTYGYKVAKLRKILNLCVKSNNIEKSGGQRGRVMYELRQIKENKDVNEDTTELELTFKTTAKETTFRALQKKKGPAMKSDNDKKVILETLRELDNTGVSASSIKELVNIKNKLSLQDVRNILEECVKNAEVEKIKKKNSILYKLLK